MIRESSVHHPPLRRALCSFALVAALAATTGGVATAASAAEPPATTRTTINPSARVASLIAQMTLDEKLSFVTPSKDPLNPGSVTTGSAAYLPGVARLGIPEVRYTDGTEGLRLPIPATAYPAPTMLGSTFEPDLAYTYGTTLGTEARAANQDVLLAPMVSLIREPQGGRNYEAYSEDPLVVAKMAGAEVSGVQDAGVIATLKHFAMNDQETNKGSVSVEVSDQALHETQLAGFQAGVDAGAGAAMCAYNEVDGTYSCSNDELLNGILKTQMNFQGYVMSDWGVTHAVTDMNAGLDQEMFWVGIQQPKLTTGLRTALTDGTVPIAALDDAVARILTSMEKVGLLDGAGANRPTFDLATGAAVAQKIAEDGGVLLKNGGSLPLSSGQTVALFGDGAIVPKTTGVLSAAVASPNATSPQQAIAARAGATVVAEQGAPQAAPIPASALTDATAFPFDATGVSTASSLTYSGTLNITDAGSYTFSVGMVGYGSAAVTIDGTRVVTAQYAPGSGSINLTAGAHTFTLAGSAAVGSLTLTWTTPAATAAAYQHVSDVAAASDVAVVFVSDVISGDRALSLPATQNDLITTVADANPHTIVVLNASSAVTMPWLDKVDAVLDMYYPGVNGAQATTALLYGDVNPSGKLAQTFPVSEDKTPFSGNAAQYPGVNNVVSYSEGVDVGYRGYQRDNITPLFPFGYGLSYTTFAYSSPKVVQRGDSVFVSLTLKNTGNREGQEVAQVYAGGSPTVTAPQALRKLVGFQKVDLAAGESKVVEFPDDLHQFEYWDTAAQGWKLGTGARTFWIGSSSADLPLTTTARIFSPSPVDGPTVTLTTTPATPASGWYGNDVQVNVDVTGEGALAYVSVDSAPMQPYSGPVTVAGEGVHVVRAIGVGADDAYSNVSELTIRIDKTAPTASVTSATGATLALAAGDDASGIASIEYSVNGGSSWTTYTGPARIAGAPRAVQYRATDKAGNVSGVKSVTVEGLEAIDAYITKVYSDLFGRVPDPAGLASWSTALRNGTAYGQVANGITYSDEYRAGMIRDTYAKYLNRAPDTTGAANWLHAMQNGLKIEDMQAGFISSDEYYANGGGTDAGWIGELYQNVLGRTPAASEIAFWQGQLNRGASRASVAHGFLYSDEHLTSVVDGYYQSLLRRSIDPSGRATWVTAIQGGARDEQIIAGIVSSIEYRSKV